MTRDEARAHLAALLDELRSAGHVIVGTHLNPDGDALGSALGFSHILAGLGISHEVLCHHFPPRNLTFLPGSAHIATAPSGRAADLAVVLDLEALDRLGSLRGAFEAAPRLAVIDHHQPHQAPGNLRIVNTASPATAAILCDLFLDSDIPISPEAAECLLTGIVTDTGSFRFPNTTPHCLHLAARLLELGARLPRITEEVYMKKQEPAVRALGLALSKMKVEAEGRLAWTILTQAEMDGIGAIEEHTEGIVNELLSVETVRVAAFFREGKEGRYKGSLRSRGDLDVAALAQSFDGGGHKNAAGLTIHPPSSRIEGEVLVRLRELAESAG